MSAALQKWEKAGGQNFHAVERTRLHCQHQPPQYQRLAVGHITRGWLSVISPILSLKTFRGVAHSSRCSIYNYTVVMHGQIVSFIFIAAIQKVNAAVSQILLYYQWWMLWNYLKWKLHLFLQDVLPLHTLALPCSETVTQQPILMLAKNLFCILHRAECVHVFLNCCPPPPPPSPPPQLTGADCW